MTKGQIELFRRSGPWIALVIAVVAYYPRFVKNLDGVELYPDAARCLMNGEVLLLCKLPLPFTYPPLFAFLMIPFAPMPIWLRELVWYAITVGATMGSFKLAELLGQRLVGEALTARELFLVQAAGLLLSSKFVLAVFENQAYDTLVLLCILLGLVALAKRELWGGIALAAAAALKATPLIFLPYLLLKRRFAAAGAFLLAFLALSYLPDLFFTPQGGGSGYFNTWLHDIAGASLLGDAGSAKQAFWSGANLLNHSLRGAVSLHIDELQAPALHRMVLHGVDLAFCAVAGVLLQLSPREERFVGVDGSILLIAMLMLSPMTSRSHYVALLLPYTVLMWAWIRDHTTRALGAVVLSASFILATATSNDLVGQSMTEWAYAHSFLVLGALVLLIYIAAIVWKAAGVWRSQRIALRPHAPGLPRPS
jgi:alpha-1,2-mannosyltransferase